MLVMSVGPKSAGYRGAMDGALLSLLILYPRFGADLFLGRRNPGSAIVYPIQSNRRVLPARTVVDPRRISWRQAIGCHGQVPVKLAIFMNML